jgi:hypothetical protein
MREDSPRRSARRREEWVHVFVRELLHGGYPLKAEGSGISCGEGRDQEPKGSVWTVGSCSA